MRSVAIWTTGAFIALALSLFILLPEDAVIIASYSARLQVPLFTGFLTLSGFLLSLKTFILIKLKEDLYDLPQYKRRLNERRLANPNVKLTLYGPLSRLGSFLIYSVACALGTALAQLTIGFIPGKLPVAICLSLAGITTGLVGVAWWQIRGSLQNWFELLEEQPEADE